MRRSINRRGVLLSGTLALACFSGWRAYADGSKGAIVNSKHDFSVTSSATIRATGEQRVCVFCHSPHDSNPNIPLWNHNESNATNYGLYSSTTLKSTVSQPTALDSSKLCLSCHDGTVALGDTINDGMIPFVQGSNYTLPATSTSNLNNSVGFADDHPFAFTPLTGSQIQNPPVNDKVKLDAAGKMQCVTCHDPHNEYTDSVTGKFLVKNNSRSALCLTCHTTVGWDAASHQQPSNPNDDSKYTAVQGAHTGYTGVANNGCESCHRPHTPVVGQRLVKDVEENTCFKCHDGSVAGYSIQAEFQSKSYRHPVSVTPSVHDDSEGPGSGSFPLPETSAGTARHSECPDCHNPHAANSNAAVPPSVNGFLRDVAGITSGGGGIAAAQNQYEVCFKCHADSANKPQSLDTGTGGTGFGRNPQRLINLANPNAYNTRLEFSSSVSWHPVVNARGLSTGIGGDVPSLRPYLISPNGQAITARPLSAGSLIYCSDCHNNDTGRNLEMGAGPVGPHGSNQVHLLERAYAYNLPPVAPGAILAPIPYSAGAYAVCDKCHDLNNSVMQDQSFKKHSTHVQTDGASCAVCHDAHGINGGSTLFNSHLINFDTSVVGPSSGGVLQYQNTGAHTGNCYLTCHGVDHNPKSY